MDKALSAIFLTFVLVSLLAFIGYFLITRLQRFKSKKKLKSLVGREGVVFREFRQDNMQNAHGKLQELRGDRAGFFKGKVEIDGAVYKAFAFEQQNLIEGVNIRVLDIYYEKYLVVEVTSANLESQSGIIVQD